LKKLGIISTYHSNDGMAIYVRILEEFLKEKFEIKIIEIDRSFLESPTMTMKRRRRKYFKSLAKQTEGCDVLNIQYENWMFGIGNGEILENFKALVDNNIPLIVTFHYVGRPDVVETSVNPVMLFRLMRSSGYNPFRAAARYYRESGRDRMFAKLMAFLKQREGAAYTAAIVHNKLDLFRVHDVYGLRNVAMHPIRYLTEPQRESAIARGREKRKELVRFLTPEGDENIKILGLFGFIDWSKGHMVAIRALRHLPKNYHVVIFGALPKYSITDDDPENLKATQYGASGNAFVQALVAEAECVNKFNYSFLPRSQQPLNKYGRKDGEDYPRVHFMGAPASTDDFLVAVAGVDAVVLPYFQTFLTASGNATWALEVRKPIFASRCTAFSEMSRLFPNRMNLFEIGNFVELAQLVDRKIEEASSDDLPYTLQSNVEAYVKILNGGQ